ncbi:MAG: hypothetical protein LBS26_04550 [Campylobacteraceae bacterium]|jgi:hypothetical protein|nr:hypothetical protein [Campylobacteraceae bacterium]
MNDMFDDLKELKQKLKLQNGFQQENIKKGQKDKAVSNASDKESRLKAEFKEFMKEADI